MNAIDSAIAKKIARTESYSMGGKLDWRSLRLSTEAGVR